jgi:hypothetical protein
MAKDIKELKKKSAYYTKINNVRKVSKINKKILKKKNILKKLKKTNTPIINKYFKIPTSKIVSKPFRQVKPVSVKKQYKVNGLLPSDLQPFESVSREIPSNLLNHAKNDYNKIVTKYFKILNKYQTVNDRNINTIKEDLKKNILKEIVSLYYPVQKYPIQILGKVFEKLAKYFVLDVSDKNDFAQNVLPLLNNFYKGQINLTEFNLI